MVRLLQLRVDKMYSVPTCYEKVTLDYMNLYPNDIFPAHTVAKDVPLSQMSVLVSYQATTMPVQKPWLCLTIYSLSLQCLVDYESET